MRMNTLRTRRRSAGFSLVEILIALGIFLIGMTAIVSLFPAAAILQRETAQEVISEMAAQSAAGVIDARELTYGLPGAANRGNIGARVHPTAASTNPSVVSIVDLYPFTDRSYPTGVIDTSFLTNASPTDDGQAVLKCDLFWIPFIQDLNGDPSNPNWVVRLFVLEADSRANYSNGLNTGDPNTVPRVFSANVTASGTTFTATGIASGDVEPGDIVMDSNGNSHSVVNVNGNDIEVLNTIPRVPNAPTQLWYSPPQGGSSSPAQRVVTVQVKVAAP